MQVILMEKVHKLGQLGDVVKVKDGYARNYLIPQGKAKRATEANLKAFAERRAELERQEAEKLAAAQARAAQLEGMIVEIGQKAGVDGKLFGSVGTVDIVEALKGKGIAVAKSEIRMPAGPIKAVGEYRVELVLHTDVHTAITVTVVPQ
ncbi:50S ribosomal protein L9 [Thiobacter aerophilum]|uniref:Large ribosomal subunit protein bL9 n=1 Tax=Thiobacter aerophilum TaxID=3121275 RepID=A0ABV0EDV9_9BURK